MWWSFGHRRRKKFGPNVDEFWFVRWIWIFVCIQSTSCLTCLTCMFTSSTTQLDNFRISTRLNRPYCLMEPIKCDRDQDVCVTITMHSGNGDYWMGAGCDKRKDFHHVGCQNVRSVTKNTLPGQVQQRHSMQRVCACPRDLCNFAAPKNLSFIFLFLLLPIIYLMLR